MASLSGRSVTAGGSIRNAPSGTSVKSGGKSKKTSSDPFFPVGRNTSSLKAMKPPPPPKPRMMPFAIKSQKTIPIEYPYKDATPKQRTTKKDGVCFNEIHRIHSALWTDESVPFKLYEVQKRPAQVLDVHVIRGKGITKGWFRDIMDSPDPYLLLRIPGTPNGVKRTNTADNKKDPTWDEHFYFYIDPYCTANLEVKLMDSQYIVDQNMGVASVPLEKIMLNDESQTRELGFLNNSKVYITLKLEEAKEPPDIQVGQALSPEERAFLAKRRRRVTAALQKLLGADDAAAPKSVKETPCVAVLGSGGGFRATAAFAGACKALQSSGLLDCAAFAAGVSGSTWYLSCLYSQLVEGSPASLEASLRERMCRGWRHLLMPRNLCRYLTRIGRKAAQGQPIAFTDLFGFLVGDTLLGERSKKPLSSQREAIQDAAAPLPIYSCVHVNRDISAQVFQEWMDFTPYDVCMQKYGATMKTELFGSKIYCGYAIKKFPELPMSFLMGLWGSAFSILFKRLVWDRNKALTYFTGSTAESERRAEDEENAFRATREGYASSNNDTGSSNDSLVPRTEDEKSSSSENEEDEEERQRLRDELVKAMAEEAERRERERLEERVSRLSVSKSHGASGRKKEKKARLTPTSKKLPADFDDLDLWTPKKKERRFKNFMAFLRRLRVRSVAKRSRRDERQRSFWRRVLDMVLSDGVWDTRTGRAGLIFNPLRGLVLRPTFPRELEQQITAKDTEPMKGMYTQSDPRSKRWFVVDSGLALNLPFPALLRPQRGVDVYIAFDFSSRPSDDASPFECLLQSEQWARLHNLRFPPVEHQVKRYLQETPREFYLFQDEKDPVCPIIMFFPLINHSFRRFKSPGVVRTTAEDLEFGDFKIFSDTRSTYSITNFHYSGKEFDRLVSLMEFNVLSHVPHVVSVLRAAVLRKRALLPPAAPDEMYLQEVQAAAAREAARRRREQRRRERARKRKLLAQKRAEESEEEKLLRRMGKKRKMPWDKPRPRKPPPPHYTKELASALGEAAATCRDHEPLAPITLLLNSAYKSALENARLVAGEGKGKGKGKGKDKGTDAKPAASVAPPTSDDHTDAKLS